MTIGELIELAKAGYKPSDVKEILKEAKELEAATEKPAENLPKGEAQPEQEKAEPEQKPKAEPDPEAKPFEHNEEFEKLNSELEDLKKQLAEKESMIKKIQKDNSSKEVSNPQAKQKTEQETLNDIVRDFM